LRGEVSVGGRIHKRHDESKFDEKIRIGSNCHLGQGIWTHCLQILPKGIYGRGFVLKPRPGFRNELADKFLCGNPGE